MIKTLITAVIQGQLSVIASYFTCLNLFPYASVVSELLEIGLA